MEITEDAQKVIDVVTKLGGRPLIVGGSVRDFLLGVKSKDIDIEVHGSVPPALLAFELESVGRVDAVGVSFGVLKFGKDVDVSFPRRDSKMGEGHRGFEVVLDPSLSVKGALSRRDLTINSMAIDPITDELIDPFGGQQDLAEGILRHTSEAFGEDPLRPMRVIQFAARFGFTVAPETAAKCRWMIPQFKTVARERLWDEWAKILTKGTDFVAFQKAMSETGWDQIYMQPFLGRSGEDETTVARRFEKSPTKPMAILASWAMSMRKEEVGPWMTKMGVPQSWRRSVESLRDGAMMMEVFYDPRSPEMRAIARMIAPISIFEASEVVRSDSKRIQMQEAGFAAGCLFEPRKPLLTGEDLKAIGLQPGPIFGQLLGQAIKKQDEEGWMDKKQALAWLESLNLTFWLTSGTIAE